MSVKLDLIVPGLLELPVDNLERKFLEDELPALNHILSYAKTIQNSHHDLESILSACMEWPDNQTLPIAQTLVGQSDADRHQALLFRPVHLQPDMYNAIVTPITDNQNNSNHINIIIKDLYDYFKEDCYIQEVSNNDWLMQLKSIEPPRYYPHFLSILGRKADPYIEQSKQRLPWYKLMNEMQMFMHQHSVNQNRQEDGWPVINSLWFWGAGYPLEHIDTSMRWYCEDELLVSFARGLGLEVHDITSLGTEKFEYDGIVIDLSILEALKVNPQADLQTLLARAEKFIFKPLLAAARNQSCKLRLRAGSDHDYQLDRLSKFRWWRKRNNLASIGELRDRTE